MPVASSRPHPLRRIAPALVLAAAATTFAVTSDTAQAARVGTEPGLPYVACADNPPGDYPGCDGTNDYPNDGAWLNFPQVGLAGSPKAQQWAQVPLTMVAASVVFHYTQRLEQVPGEKTGAEYWYDVNAFFVSPDGSTDPYGSSAIIPVRSLAFGSIPAEIELQVTQATDADGLPIPFHITPHDYQIYRGTASTVLTKVVDATSFESSVNVNVRSVKLDGVDVGISTTCKTGEYAKISASSQALEVDEPRGYEGSGFGYFEEVFFDPAVHHYGIQGGTFQGGLDIPAFTGCATSNGDDLSLILTSMLSGENNPIAIRVGATNCQIYNEQGGRPIPAGVNSPADPRSGCVPSTHPNEKIVTVPSPFPLPTEAPAPVQ